MGLDRFELLELRRDNGVQTYHAREIATARPVQVHLLSSGSAMEHAALLGMLNRLPDPERRRIIDRGDSLGVAYVVTDRLAGYVDFREWVVTNTASLAARPVYPSVDDQFYRLFDPPPAPLFEELETPVETLHEHQKILPVAAKSLGGVLLGIMAALMFLGLLVAFFAFRPR